MSEPPKKWREKLARPDRVTAYVTADEHEAVKIAAARARVNVSEWLRALLARELGWPREEP